MCYEVNNRDEPVPLERAFDELVMLTAERNFDIYQAESGVIGKA